MVRKKFSARPYGALDPHRPMQGPRFSDGTPLGSQRMLAKVPGVPVRPLQQNVPKTRSKSTRIPVVAASRSYKLTDNPAVPPKPKHHVPKRPCCKVTTCENPCSQMCNYHLNLRGCQFPGCNNSGHVFVCQDHNPRTCMEVGCKTEAVTGGFCISHTVEHEDLSESSTPSKPLYIPCTAEGCDKKPVNCGFCADHVPPSSSSVEPASPSYIDSSERSSSPHPERQVAVPRTGKDPKKFKAPLKSRTLSVGPERVRHNKKKGQ